MYILITYDVNTTEKAGQKRLRQVARACMDYGQRVQNSVFECELTEVQLTLLKTKLSSIIDPNRDTIRIYHLHRNYNAHIEVLGIQTAYNVSDAMII